MAKRIGFLITDSGMDGRAPKSVIFASYGEKERDDTFNASKNKNFYHREDIVIDEDPRRAQALGKLDAVDRLMLGIEQKKR